MTKKDLLKLAIDTWGVQSQIMMAVEEMGELLQALSKQSRYGDVNTLNLLSEIADVKVMIDQLTLIFEPMAKISVADLEREKLARLAGFLGVQKEWMDYDF